ncbi:MAG: Gfo/Idh/MocA family oxidoreductase [bacterium]|nr:Gfo/Idh/MocA family oxidoreductase [bacterium]
MSPTRRGFLGALSAASYQRVLGANERVGVGFIGYGLIGAQHVYDFKNQRDVDMVAMSEVHQPRMEQGIAACGGRAKPYKDFRKMLEDKDIQAVVVSTPDHWHALHTMMACAAGKDVYVEKPMTLFVREGRWMTDVARKHKRVVQVGTQQRSGLHYQKAKRLIEEGYIGKVHSVRMGSYRNVMPGFGRPTDPLPSNLEYEMWLGPAPKRPYSPHRSLYHFRWFWDYSGGQMTNLAAHSIDIVQWYLGAKGPNAVASVGGRLVLEDDGETSDTQDAVFEYDGFTTSWSHREASVGSRGGSGLEFLGTKGSLKISRGGYQVYADEKRPPENAIPRFQGHPQGGPQRVEVKKQYWTEATKEPGSSPKQFDGHVRNFLDCMKSRQRPVTDVEDGHFTALACHLSNISMHVGRKVRWDTETEEILGDREASQRLERPYRQPWDDVLRSLL